MTIRRHSHSQSAAEDVSSTQTLDQKEREWDVALSRFRVPGQRVTQRGCGGIAGLNHYLPIPVPLLARCEMLSMTLPVSTALRLHQSSS
jgi:hypothetical protein